MESYLVTNSTADSERFQIPESNTGAEFLLSKACRAFLCALHDRFEDSRQNLLQLRREQAMQLLRGGRLAPPIETQAVRDSFWKVAPAPHDLTRRTVEITGPAEPKMIINALNSGADVFMADCEDALSPTWFNILNGHRALGEAVRRKLEYTGDNGKSYQLHDGKLATLVMRPRGWHLVEKNVRIGGRAMSASLFDFGVYFFHNARELISRGSGPYFYLPKMESYLEARLWNSVFLFAQDALEIPRGTVRATVLIETIPAAFQMEEILFELREHAAGLNAGRWDYLFSLIKKFHFDPEMILPDRSKVTMRAPFMEAYCQALIQACHKHQAHAIGGTAAFLPNRREPEITQRALEQVAQDKAREAGMGFDGSWVAHPDLIEVARREFVKVLGDSPHQKKIVPTLDADHMKRLVPSTNGTGVTIEGVRTNIGVCLEYIAHWLEGTGAVAINNLMEDAATAEIARSQLWQWRHHRVRLEAGEFLTADLYEQLAQLEVLKRLGADTRQPLLRAKRLLDALVLSPAFAEFFTTEAYPQLP